MTAEDHLAIHGIPKSSKSAKEIMESFGDEELGGSAEIILEKAPDSQVEDDGQSTLDRFG